jgi:hypothetical protein
MKRRRQRTVHRPETRHLPKAELHIAGKVMSERKRNTALMGKLEKFGIPLLQSR